MIRTIRVDQFDYLIDDIQSKKIIINKITYKDKVVKYFEVKNSTDEMALFAIKNKDIKRPSFEEFSYHLYFDEGGEEVVAPNAIIDLDLRDDVDEVIAIPEVAEPTPEEFAEIMKKKKDSGSEDTKSEEIEELY